VKFSDPNSDAHSPDLYELAPHENLAPRELVLAPRELVLAPRELDRAPRELDQRDLTPPVQTQF